MSLREDESNKTRKTTWLAGISSRKELISKPFKKQTPE